MEVPFLDLDRQYRKHRTKFVRAIQRVVDSQYFVNGQEVEKFENDFADYTNSKYCVAVSSGTNALEIALKAHHLDNSVIGVPGLSFVATAESVYNVNSTPVYLDVDLDTGLILPDQVELYASKLDAILPVHLFGQQAPMNGLEPICEEYNLDIIGDAAQAHGASYSHNEKVGSRHTTAWSFYPSKNLGAWGDAGAITTNNAAIAREAELYRNHGRTGGRHKVVGTNARMDELQAALLQTKLPHLDKWNGYREMAANYYKARLRNTGIKTLPHNRRSAWHAFPVLVPEDCDRDETRKELASRGIQTRLYYGKALPEYDSLRHLPAGNMNGVPNAVKRSRRSIALPLFPEIEADEQDFVINHLRDICND